MANGRDDTLDSGETRRGARGLGRGEPSFQGFRAAPAPILRKIRGEGRAAAALALLIIVATLAVVSVAHLGEAAQELGTIIGLGEAPSRM